MCALFADVAGRMLKSGYLVGFEYDSLGLTVLSHCVLGSYHIAVFIKPQLGGRRGFHSGDSR